MHSIKHSKKTHPKTAAKKITTMTLSSETPLHAPSNEVISSETNMADSKKKKMLHPQNDISKRR